MAKQDKDEEEALAALYREGAKDDAWLALGKGRPGESGSDATLSVTPEKPDVPLHDIAHPDPADGEDHSVPPSPRGPAHDALMRGLEPGETGME